MGQRIRHRFRKNAWCAVLAVILPFALGGMARAYDDPGDDILTSLDPALGIGAQFGRWDGTITLVYDPDGAPAMFADTDTVLAYLEAATAQWELVSGIRYNVAGADSNIANDDNEAPENKDGLVRVYWTDTGGAAGRAGPDGDYYDFDKGYYPYIDGSVELDEKADTWNYPGELVSVLVHELGHLMGLGHSDNPDSVMYANPYNHLHYPRADDILAIRAIYGKGSLAISDLTQPIAQWQYVPLPDAPASATEFVFKPNQAIDSGAFISVGSDTPVTVIDANSSGQYVRFNFGGIGNFSSNRSIDIDATLYVVDPFGYLYDENEHRISCDVGFACDGGWVSVASTEAAKTVPGTWTVYVVDNDTQTTLASLGFEVDNAVSFNQAPTAEVSVSAVAGSLGNAVKVSLALADPEGNAIDVIWHPHGDLGDQDGDGFLDTSITDRAAAGDTVSRTITFQSVDTHTLYIELVDDQPRYDGSTAGSSSAGDGFQSLIAVTVSLPYVNADDVTIATSFPAATGGDSGSGGDIAAVVDAIADTSTLGTITQTGGGVSTAGFNAGASADDGLSTATQFSTADDVTIAGAVIPQAADVGQGGNIFVVLATGATFSFLDADGNFQSWPGFKLKTLEAAYSVSALGAKERFKVFSGKLQSGQYRIFLGYQLTAGGPLHFNLQGFKVNVD